jgi:chromosome segregation ATPase
VTSAAGDALARAATDLAGVPSQLRTQQQTIARTSQQISELKKKSERILRTPHGADSQPALKRLANDLRQAEWDLKTKENAIQKAAEAETNAKELVAKLDRERAGLSREIACLTRQIDAANRELERLRAELAGAGDLKSIQAGLSAQREAQEKRRLIACQVDRERSALETTLHQRVAVATHIAVLNERIDSLRKTLEKSTSEAAQIEQTLKSNLAHIALPDGADELERIEKLLAELGRQAGCLRDRLTESKYAPNSFKSELSKPSIRESELPSSTALHSCICSWARCCVPTSSFDLCWSVLSTFSAWKVRASS